MAVIPLGAYERAEIQARMAAEEAGARAGKKPQVRTVKPAGIRTTLTPPGPSSLPPTMSDPPPFFPPPTSSSASQARHDALLHALAPKTLSGYTSTIARFWAFCDRAGTPRPERFPASEAVLADFAASFAGNKAGSTVANALAALHTWHNANGCPWLAGTQLPLVVKGVTNMAPATSKRAPRPAVTRDMIVALYVGLDLGTPLDASVFAAATLAFWGQCRLGEFLGTSRTRHDASAHPSRASLETAPATGESIRLFLPRTKTTGTRGESIQITHQRGRADPSYALTKHFHTNRGIAPTAHLFAFRGPSQETRCLTKEVFVDRCNEIWATTGVPRMTGHSFRIGGTNAYLEAGVPSDVVRVKGRWKSDAYFIYWRNQDRLAAAHTVRIKPSKDLHARVIKRRQG